MTERWDVTKALALAIFLIDVVCLALLGGKPRAEPRRCSRRPLMASVGPLLVPGRSK